MSPHFSSQPTTLKQYVLGLEALANGLDPEIQLFLGTDGQGDVDLYLPPEPATPGAPAEVTDQLLGFDAPGHWTALAVSAGATVRSLDDPTLSERARLTFAIDRSGHLASQVTAADRDRAGVIEFPSGLVDSADPDRIEGFMVALARRVMGLANQPIHTGISQWWHARWLVSILEFVDRPEGGFDGNGSGAGAASLQLSDLLVLHPGINRPIEAHEDPAELIDLARLSALNTDWDSLRKTAAREVQGWISTELAAWCDSTVFAYLAARDWPPPEWTLGVLARYLEPELLTQIEDLLGMDRIIDQTDGF